MTPWPDTTKELWVLFAATLVIIVGPAYGAAVQQDCEWLRLIAPARSGVFLAVSDLATQRTGVAYVVGDSVGEITFGSTNVSSTNSKPFIARYDRAGDLSWVLQQENEGPRYGLYFSGIAVDQSNNVFACGGITIRTTNAPRDYCIAKFDSQGRELWFRQYGQRYIDDNAWKVAVNDVGETYVIGGTDSSNPNDQRTFSIIKHDSSGAQVWVRSIQRTGFAVYMDIAIDPLGNVWAIGSFYDSVSVEGHSLPVAGAANFLLIKYGPDGRLLVIRHFGQTGSNQYSFGDGVACDKLGNVFGTCQISGPAMFGPTNLVSSATNDIVLFRCDASGEVIWVKQIRGRTSCWNSRPVISPMGNVLIAEVMS